MPARKESMSAPDLTRDVSTKEGLTRLKNELTPKQQKEALKEGLSNGARVALSDIDSFEKYQSFLSDPENKKNLGVSAVVGLLAWYLKPEVKEREDGKVSQKEDVKKGEDEVHYSEIRAKANEESEVKYATIDPKAKPEVVLKAVETNAKNLDELHRNYLSAKTPAEKQKAIKELSYFVFRGITAKESGLGKNEKRKLRLVNQAAVGPGSRRKLKEKYGIIVPPLKGSGSLFPNESYLASYDAFKERICSYFQPNVSGAKQLSNALRILIGCACGKFQVLLKYWLKGVKGKKELGEAEARIVYNYFKSHDLQQKTAMGIIGSIGKKHNWNPAYVMVEYYAGARGVKLLKQNHSAIYRKQYGGHGSMMDYVKRTTALTNRFISQNQKA